MLELIEAGWNFSILKPRRLESRPYTAGALTYCSLGGNVSGFPCPRGSREQGKGGMRGHADYLPEYMPHRIAGHKPTLAGLFSDDQAASTQPSQSKVPPSVFHLVHAMTS